MGTRLRWPTTQKESHKKWIAYKQRKIVHKLKRNIYNEIEIHRINEIATYKQATANIPWQKLAASYKLQYDEILLMHMHSYISNLNRTEAKNPLREKLIMAAPKQSKERKTTWLLVEINQLQAACGSFP